MFDFDTIEHISAPFFGLLASTFIAHFISIFCSNSVFIRLYSFFPDLSYWGCNPHNVIYCHNVYIVMSIWYIPWFFDSPKKELDLVCKQSVTVYRENVKEVLPMTDAQRQRVFELHSQGLGYSKIAQATGISINTIKSSLQRATQRSTQAIKVVAGKPQPSPSAYCKQCKRLLVYTPGHKKKQFCSDKCRMAWWNSHLDLVNHRTFTEYTCPMCNKVFRVYGSRKRKYCSHECYIAKRFYST